MKLKGLLKVALVLLAVSSLFVACDTIAGGKWPVMFEPFEPEEGYIYLKPNENWLQNDGSDVAPRFAVYTAPKDWSSAEWYDMEETEENSGIYKVKLPADKKYHWVIFARMNGSKTENNWDTKYNQSKDEVLVYADDDASNDYKVLYIVADGSWDKSSDSFWHNPDEYVGNIVKYTVTFTADSDVTGVPEKQEVKENTQISAPAEPSKEGYIFEGWYDGDTKITFPYTVTKDVTLKAKFKEMSKDITDVVYSYTVPLAKLGTWSNSEKAQIVILAMTDSEAVGKTINDSYKKTGDVFIYTHTDGNYYIDGVSNTYATVKDGNLTVYYKLPKEDVAAGKTAYVIGLVDKEIAGADYVFSPAEWGADVVKMKAEGTIPTNPVKNEAPAGTPTIYFYCKAPSWADSMSIALGNNGYDWGESAMTNLGNGWYVFEANQVENVSASTTYQLRIKQGSDTKYQKAGQSGGDPTITTTTGFVVVDISDTGDIQWTGSDWYTTAVTTPLEPPVAG